MEDKMNNLDLDALIKRIDERIAELEEEKMKERLSDGEESADGTQIPSIHFINRILENKNISIHFFDFERKTTQLEFSDEDEVLIDAFREILVSINDSFVSKMDIEDTVIAFVKCRLCTYDIYKKILYHKMLQRVCSPDDRKDINRSVIKQKPDLFDNDAIERFANEYYYARKYDDALELFLIICPRYEKNEFKYVETLNSIGCCLLGAKEKDYKRMYKAFKEAIDINPKAAYVFNNWSYALMSEYDTLPDSEQKGKEKLLQEALEKINSAIQLNNKEVKYLSNKAHIEYELGRYDVVLQIAKLAKGISSKYKDIKTILKLSIDSRIKMSLASGGKELYFKDLFDDLMEIYHNEPAGSKIYFKSLDVYRQIKNKEKANEICMPLTYLEFSVDQLLGAISLHNPQQGIYYYTSIDGVRRILTDEKEEVKYRLPIFNANHMNDPREGKELELTLQKVIGQDSLIEDVFTNRQTELDAKRKVLDTDFTFLKSFTTNADSLPMWIHYGDQAKGCCVKVAKEFFDNFTDELEQEEKTLVSTPFDHRYHLFRVLYIKDGKLEEMVSRNINELFDDVVKHFKSMCDLYKTLGENNRKIVLQAVMQIVGKLKYLFKSADYSYEKELRVILNRPLSVLQREDIDIKLTDSNDKAPVPRTYIYSKKSLPIEEIIFGPKVLFTDDLIPFFELKVLSLNGYNKDKALLTKSEIEYR